MTWMPAADNPAGAWSIEMTDTAVAEPTEPTAAPVEPGAPLAVHGLSQRQLQSVEKAVGGTEITAVTLQTPTDDRTLVVSARAGRDGIAITRRWADAGSRVVVLLHPGLEGIAAQLLRAGARAIVAEGNEAVLAELDRLGPQVPGRLLESVARRAEDAAQDDLAGHDLTGGPDPTTGLPGGRALAADLRPVEGEDPFTGLLVAVHLGQLTESALPGGLGDLLRRRIAITWAASRTDATRAYHLSPATTLLLHHGDVASLERLMETWHEDVSAYAPRGVELHVHAAHTTVHPDTPLDVAVSMVVDAAEVASRHGQRVVRAEDLADLAGGDSELAALELAMHEVERQRRSGVGHARRIAVTARRLAVMLDLGDDDLVVIGLAARFHAVGEVVGERALPAIVDARSADVLAASCGTGVADAVRAHRAPPAPDTPLSARILGVARAYEDAHARGLGVGGAIASLHDAGLDESVVATLSRLVAPALQVA